MTDIALRTEPMVKLVRSTGTDIDVAMAAKVSFDRHDDQRLEDPEHIRGLINFLVKNKHHSTLEHCHFTFYIECPLFVRSEIMRHRTSSYNEISARYSTWDFEFHIPDSERPLVQAGRPGAYNFVPGTPDQQAVAIKMMERAYTCAVESYYAMLEAGIAKEVARNVLPVGLYTKFYMSVNARNLMHFLDLRLDPTATDEIRRVASQMETHLKAAMPITYAAWKECNG